MNHQGQSSLQSLQNYSSEKSEVQKQYEAHEARLARMGGAKKPRIISKPKPPWQGIDETPYWPQFWMWQLIDWKPAKDDLSLRTIIDTVAEHFDLPVYEMLSPRRNVRLCLPRHVAMYLCRELTGRSFPEIGRMMCRRDHTTVIHGARKITIRMRYDLNLSQHVAQLRRKLGR